MSAFEKIKGKLVFLTGLTDNSNNLLGLINSYHYIHTCQSSSKFLFWSMNMLKNTGNPSITIKLYDVDLFKPLKLKKK